MRSEDTRELITDPLAFALLALIAFRAQRTSAFNRYGLEPGQAFIGDYKACGMSEQQYRTAKSKLSKWGFASFKSTNKGTIAKLIDTRVFDINSELVNGHINSPITDGQRAGNGQSTTTNNVISKESKNGETPQLVRGDPRWISFEKELDRWIRDFDKLPRPESHERGSKQYVHYYELRAKIEARQKMLEAVK